MRMVFVPCWAVTLEEPLVTRIICFLSFPRLGASHSPNEELFNRLAAFLD